MSKRNATIARVRSGLTSRIASKISQSHRREPGGFNISVSQDKFRNKFVSLVEARATGDPRQCAMAPSQHRSNPSIGLSSIHLCIGHGIWKHICLNTDVVTADAGENLAKLPQIVGQ